jgi:hypothetical protein
MKHLLLLCTLIGCTPISKKLHDTAAKVENSQVRKCYNDHFPKMVSIMERQAKKGKFDAYIALNCSEIQPEIDESILHGELYDFLREDSRLEGMYIIQTNTLLTFYFSWRSA